MARSRDELSRLDDDELRSEARARGLAVGRTLSRSLMIDLLAGEADADEAPDDDDNDAPLPPQLSTVTMARLYARQGFDREAAEVCRVVLARHPEETRARRLLERLAAPETEPHQTSRLSLDLLRRFASVGPVDEEPTTALPPLPARSGRSMIVVLPRSPTSVFAFWEAEQEIDRRAQERARGEATRVLRVFTAWHGRDGLCRHTRDEVVEGCVGELFLTRCQPGAVLRAALGWLGTDELLVPICHSSTVRTPVGAASARRRPLWSRLRPAGVAAPSSSSVARLMAKLHEIVPMSLPWESPGGASIAWPPPSAPVAEAVVETFDLQSSPAGERH